jgi:hypothetical protein
LLLEARLLSLQLAFLQLLAGLVALAEQLLTLPAQVFYLRQALG